ncbi:hypothetical protein STENM327S_07626 [Streptomyces tendae]
MAGGLHSVGLSYARELKAETVQVFVANPRGWATPAGNPKQDEGLSARPAPPDRSPRTCTRRT